MEQSFTCADCAQVAPRTGSRQIRCSPCAEGNAKTRKAANYRLHAERQRAERRARYAANRDAELAAKRKANYGLTDEELLVFLAAQDGRCPICLEPLLWPKVAVDHCHDTGRVRGLLHGICNSGVGHLADDPERCERAAAYLRQGAAN